MAVEVRVPVRVAVVVANGGRGEERLRLGVQQRGLVVLEIQKMLFLY